MVFMLIGKIYAIYVFYEQWENYKKLLTRMANY